MSRREAWITALAVFAVALAVRIVAASVIDFPKPEDTAYYVGVARNLVEGRGPRVRRPLELRHAAPRVAEAGLRGVAASAIAAGGHPDGPRRRAAPDPPRGGHARGPGGLGVAGAIVAVLAWRLAADVAGERGLAGRPGPDARGGAGLTAAVYLPLLLHSSLPDSTMLFGALVLGAALLMTRVCATRAARERWTPDSSGSACRIGLAALTRNEAIWLALTWAWLAWRLKGRSAACGCA